jgi:hypothetical protein
LLDDGLFAPSHELLKEIVRNHSNKQTIPSEVCVVFFFPKTEAVQLDDFIGAVFTCTKVLQDYIFEA